MPISRRNFIKGLGAAGAAAMVVPEMTFASDAEANAFEVVEEELLSGEAVYVDSPVLASDGKGAAWAAWLNRLDDDRELVMINEFRDKWEQAVPATDQPGQYESPRIACAPGKKPMLVWIKIDGNRWVLESSVYGNGGFGKTTAVGSGKGKAGNPCLIAADNGIFWLAWESYAKGKSRICLKKYAKGAWGKTVSVTDGTANAYDPNISVDKAGNVWVVYSAAKDQARNVYLTSVDVMTGAVNPTIDIAVGRHEKTSVNANCKPSVLCADDGRVWIAYQSRGAHPRGKNYPACNAPMECHVVCYADGCLWAVAPQSDSSGGRYVMADGNDQYPTLMKDRDGRLWLFSRNSLEERRTWNVRASFLDQANGWTPPESVLDGKQLGRIDRPAVGFADRDSFWVAWQSDNLLKGGAPVHSFAAGIRVARVKVPPLAGELKAAGLRRASAGKSVAPTRGRARVARRTVEADGEKYTLLFGNLHEHSMVSRCWADGSDGTFDDNYRYGMDIEGYDFIALTDHGFDLYEMAWRGTRRAAAYYNEPPSFVALPAYEWTLIGGHLPPSAGHRNIIFGSDEDAAKFVWQKKAVYGVFLEDSNRMDKVWNLLRDKGIEAVTIPHHPADKVHPVDWSFHDPHYQSVVEIFQVRESAEHEGCPRQTPNATAHKGCFVQDALARGHKMGFIASGDHNSMGVGAAALLVKEVSRRGIVEALQARRCYGTTGDKIFVDFRVNGRLMGQEIESSKPPRVSAKIAGTSPIKSITLFKSNQAALELTEAQLDGGTEYTLDFADDKFDGDCFYYLRVVQANNEIAWASPVWVRRA